MNLAILGVGWGRVLLPFTSTVRYFSHFSLADPNRGPYTLLLLNSEEEEKKKRKKKEKKKKSPSG